jgi:hypothetical protein
MDLPHHPLHPLEALAVHLRPRLLQIETQAINLEFQPYHSLLEIEPTCLLVFKKLVVLGL